MEDLWAGEEFSEAKVVKSIELREEHEKGKGDVPWAKDELINREEFKKEEENYSNFL